MATVRKPRGSTEIRRRSLGDTVRELRASIRGFEKKHGRTTEDALAGVRRGEIAETREISRWLSDYWALTAL